MSRYRGPRLKITRRLGQPLPGLVQKLPRTGKETQPPGQHGTLRRKNSQYAIRLQEKQKVRYHYGLTESQMIRYVQKARDMKGPTGSVLLTLLEKRLDNTLFRCGLAPTMRAARQLINHGHITINSKKVTIPSYHLEPGLDVITYADPSGSQQKIDWLNNSKFATQKREGVSVQTDNLGINELLIIEFYSRK